MSLDEHFLKRNVPGKYSCWDDNDGRRTRHDDEGGESDDIADQPEHSPPPQGAEGRMPTAPVSTPLPAGGAAATSAHNTGVKGVLNDRRAAKEAEERRRSVEAAERRHVVQRLARGSVLAPGEAPISAAAAAEERRLRRSRQERGRPREGDGLVDSGGSDGSDAEDEDFLRRYRQSRIEQLKCGANWPVFGEIQEVDAVGFADAVDSADPRVMVVVHMYADFVRDCVVLNNFLEGVARKMSYARFLRLKARAEFDPVALPVLMIYRNGELVHNMTPVTDALPREFSSDDVEWLLESRGVVNPLSIDARSGTTGVVHSGRTTSSLPRKEERRVQPVGDDYDSDDAELDAFCAGFNPSI